MLELDQLYIVCIKFVNAELDEKTWEQIIY